MTRRRRTGYRAGDRAAGVPAAGGRRAGVASALFRTVDTPAVASPAVAALLILVLAGAAMTGCVHTRVINTPAPGSGTSATVSVYLTNRHCRDGGPTVDGALTELYLLKDGRRQLVRRDDRGEWTMTGLVPGHYEVETRCRFDEDGERDELSGDTSERFDLSAGENAHVRIVLEKKPVLLIAGLGAAAVAVVAIALHNDIDLPDLHDLAEIAPRLPPPPPDFVVLGLDLAMYPDEYIVPGIAVCHPDGGDGSLPAPAVPAPAVTEHAPAHESRDVPLDADIRFRFSTPVDPESLDHRNVVVSCPNLGIIPGGIYYLEKERTCVYDPLRDLPPGEVITVTLIGKGIRTLNGELLSRNYRWSFATADSGS